MATAKKLEWTNDVEPTARDVKLAELAVKAKDVIAQAYNITSRNTTAIRVIHDHDGNQITIGPGETKVGVRLRPNIADYLGKLDLTLTAAVGAR